MKSVESLESRRLLSLTPLGSEVPVPESIEAQDWDIAVADNGMYVIVSGVLPDGLTPPGDLGGAVHIVRYSAAGQQLGDVLRIDLAADRLIPDVSASIDADGDIVVAYTDTQLAGVNAGVKVVRISKDGVMSAPMDIDTGYGPSVSMDAGGAFFVAWNHSDGDSIMVRAYDAAGVPRAAAFPVLTDNVSTLYGLHGLAANPDGSGAIFTASSGGEAPDTALFGRVSTTALLGSIGGASGGISQSGAPTVDILPDNSFIFAYERDSGGPIGGPYTNFAVYAQRYSAAGEKIGGEIEIGASLPGEGLAAHTYYPDLAVEADGSFVVSFIQQGDESDTVYLQRFNADSSPDGDPVSLGASVHRGFPLSDGESTPQIGVDASGIVIVTRHPTAENAVNFRRFSNDQITVERGSLSILGTAVDDAITVAISGANLVVTYNSTTRTFPAADVQFISINGLGGNDTITNDTAVASTLSGGEGDDTVYGGGGNDKIRGEAGRDSLWGREGNDTLFGDDGVDSLYGNGGRDRIDGGANSDHMRGNSGRDKMFGGHGNDRVYGSESADWLWGGIGNDQLFGEGSNDILHGEAGADTVYGLAGDDVFVSYNDGSDDELIGGRGRDTVLGYADDILTGIEVTA